MTAPPPFPGASGPPPGWSAPAYNPPQPSRTARQGGKLVTAAAAAGVVVAIAALVVALTRHPAPPPATAGQSASAAASADTTEADKAFCNTIAPLLKRSEVARKAFAAAGAATASGDVFQKFLDDTREWAKEAQQAADTAPGPPRYLTRTFQRYIDDMLLYVGGVRQGSNTKYDDAEWTDASESDNGPIVVCDGVGVRW